MSEQPQGQPPAFPPPGKPRLRARFFAKLWGRFGAGVDKLFRYQKDEVLVDLPDRIVELGPGLGSNFKRYPTGATVLGFEPNTAMHAGLRGTAEEYGLKLEIHAEDFREAGLPTDSEDVVISTLVLCSVGDQAAMLKEIKRVLKPGGRLLFLEHVASDNSAVHAYQKLIRIPWGGIGDGCNPAAPTFEAVQEAGFASVDAKRDKVGVIVNPTHPHYWGVATK